MISQIFKEIHIRILSNFLSLIIICFYFFQQAEEENFVEILIELINYDLNRNLFVETLQNQEIIINTMEKDNILLNYSELDLNESFLETNQQNLEILNKRILIHFLLIWGLTLSILHSCLFFIPSWQEQEQKKKKKLIKLAILGSFLIYLDTIDTEYIYYIEQMLLEYNMNLNTEKTENILQLLINIEQMFYINFLCFFSTFLIIYSTKFTRLLYFFIIFYIFYIAITFLELSIENIAILLLLVYYENTIQKRMALRKVGFEPTIVINK